MLNKENFHNNKGLTLVEMLVAFAISSVIVLGTYALFKATTDIRISFKDKSDDTAIQTSVTLLINRDLNAALETLPALSDYSDDDGISFVTHNSLYFNGAIPVTVTYAMNDGFLVREELNEAMNYKQVIRLIDGVTQFDVLYFNGTEYLETAIDYKMLKIQMKVDGYQFDVIAGKLRI